jgi:hypothetical protein
MTTVTSDLHIEPIQFIFWLVRDPLTALFSLAMAIVKNSLPDESDEQRSF